MCTGFRIGRNCREFHNALPRLLRPGGVYSYFNGLAADNSFFHRVYCELVRRELTALGLVTQFVPLPINAAAAAEVRAIRKVSGFMKAPARV